MSRELSFLYCKGFILENDFFCGELEKHFRQQYRILRMMPHPEIAELGNYSKFDRTKAEMIFMDILRQFLRKNEEGGRVKTNGMHIRRRPIPSRLQVEPVVSDDQKVNIFLTSNPF